MKTLYININGEDIQSFNDMIVVGTPDDAIVDKFYYELGKEIVKGVDAPGVRGLAKNIVKSYKDIDEMSFDKITKQWLKVKDKLLGEDPTGSETIELPMEYVKWLQNYGDASHTEIAKSLYARNRLVEISLDKIYRNSVNIIINSIESDNYGQFVVNDEIVTDDSAISIAIMKKFDGIAFKPYKKEDVCPNCGKNPCECPKVCPKCGKSPCECEHLQKWSTLEDFKNGVIILDGITLNETTIKDLRTRGCLCKNDEYAPFLILSEVNNYLKVYIPQCRYKDLARIKNEFPASADIDDNFLINEEKLVKMIDLRIGSWSLELKDIPVFNELGLNGSINDFDYDVFVQSLEDFGYIKVENPMDQNDDDADFFAHKIHLSNNWILLRIDTSRSYEIALNFCVCFLDKLISYNTGRVIKTSTRN